MSWKESLGFAPIQHFLATISACFAPASKHEQRATPTAAQLVEADLDHMEQLERLRRAQAREQHPAHTQRISLAAVAAMREYREECIRQKDLPTLASILPSNTPVITVTEVAEAPVQLMNPQNPAFLTVPNWYRR